MPEVADREGLRWWREVAYAAAFYVIYSLIRNGQGSAAVSEGHALRNALRVVRLEEALGIYHERAVQAAFLGWWAFVELWNFFYASAHFVVTVWALVFLFRRFPDRYRRWRNVLAATTALALVGFAAFPLMPPRLLPPQYGFVDTLRRFGSPWSFESGPVSRVSNQFAAMPSLHMAWALWSSCVLFPALRRTSARALAVAYPAMTLFAIVVTGNHFVLDAVGGAAVLGVGSVLAFRLADHFQPGGPPPTLRGAPAHP